MKEALTLPPIVRDARLSTLAPGRHVWGRTLEDGAVELEFFPRGGRILSVASAGCVALALAARGDCVTAVASDPVQAEYVRRRQEGRPGGAGRFERTLERLAFRLRSQALDERLLRRFLELEHVDEQSRFWREHLDSEAWRTFLRRRLAPALFNLASLGGRRPLDGPAFAKTIRKRLERTWSHHSNRSNPFLWRLFMAKEPPGRLPSPSRDESCLLIEDDVVSFLDGRRPHSFDGFHLSNLLDEVDSNYRRRLCEAVARTGTRGAKATLRSLADASLGAPHDYVTLDRSPIWGRLHVLDAEELPRLQAVL